MVVEDIANGTVSPYSSRLVLDNVADRARNVVYRAASWQVLFQEASVVPSTLLTIEEAQGR